VYANVQFVPNREIRVPLLEIPAGEYCVGKHWNS